MVKGKLYLAIASVLLSGGVLAQQSPPPDLGPRVPISVPADVSSIPVELLPPGARALGLAGAFTAVADDATAAEANPAGLTILSAPEFSIHFRDSDYDIEYFDPESRNASNFGATGGQPIKTFSDSNSNVSFASFVKPWEKFVFSAFYTNNLDLDATSPTDVATDNQFFDRYESNNSLSAEVDGYGVSFAFRPTEMVSVGLTIKRSELTLRTFDQQIIDDFRDFEFLFAEARPDLGGAGDFAGVLDDRFNIQSSLDGQDSDTTFNAGLLFNPGGAWSVGFVYKEGGTYDIQGTGTLAQTLQCVGTGPLADLCREGFATVDLSDFNDTQVNPIRSTISLPDTVTLGLAWRPDEAGTWLISADVNNIDYGDLPQPRPTTLGLNVDVGSGGTNDIERIGDAVTYHLGVEKVFFPSWEFMDALTVRGGAFTDDDHDGTRLIDSDDTHLTLGVGGVFGKFQVDVATEFSDRVDNLVLSAIYRF